MRTNTAPAPAKRINVILPSELYQELSETIPPRKRNQFIVELIERELRRMRLLRTLEETRGAWSDEDYPHLKTREDVDRYVRQLREQWVSRSWDEIVKEAEADGRSSSRHQSADPVAAQ